VRLKPMLILAVALCLSALPQVAAAASPSDPCDLPRDLQGEIVSKYPETKVVTLPDLGEDDRGFFQKDHGNSCPGLVKVDFYGDGKLTLGLVLIPKNGAKGKAELILAHQVGGRWETMALDTAEEPPVPVVWNQPPGEYHDVYGKKKIRATRPVIILAGYESWAILYSWTGKRASKIWIAD
jgi:hypothetical protein